jgi:OOP family OmpA-OmpF porin
MKKVVLVGALLAASMSTAAMAADNPGGFYVGAGVGQFNLSVDDLDDFGHAITNLDDEDTSVKIFAGWRFARFLSLEAAYINLGEASADVSATGSAGKYNLKLEGFAPAVIGTLPLGPIELSAKVGYYYYDVDVSADLTSGGGSQALTGHSRNDLFYGLGLGIVLFEHLAVTAEYEVFDLENYGNSGNVWLSGAWRF